MSHTLGDYEDFIYANFINDALGFDFSKFERKVFESNIKVDLKVETLIDIEKLRSEINTIDDFIHRYYFNENTRPIWYKVNVIDQAINAYVGMGLLNVQTDWLKFIIDYLNTDRAEEGGDTIFAIFDINFQWVVCFTLSQDDSILKIERLEK